MKNRTIPGHFHCRRLLKRKHWMFHNPLLKIRDYPFVKQFSNMIQVECLCKEFWNKLNFIYTKF